MLGGVRLRLARHCAAALGRRQAVDLRADRVHEPLALAGRRHQLGASAVGPGGDLALDVAGRVVREAALDRRRALGLGGVVGHQAPQLARLRHDRPLGLARRIQEAIVAGEQIAAEPGLEVDGEPLGARRGGDHAAKRPASRSESRNWPTAMTRAMNITPSIAANTAPTTMKRTARLSPRARGGGCVAVTARDAIRRRFDPLEPPTTGRFGPDPSSRDDWRGRA